MTILAQAPYLIVIYFFSKLWLLNGYNLLSLITNSLSSLTQFTSAITCNMFQQWSKDKVTTSSNFKLTSHVSPSKVCDEPFKGLVTALLFSNQSKLNSCKLLPLEVLNCKPGNADHMLCQQWPEDEVPDELFWVLYIFEQFSVSATSRFWDSVLLDWAHFWPGKTNCFCNWHGSHMASIMHFLHNSWLHHLFQYLEDKKLTWWSTHSSHAPQMQSCNFTHICKFKAHFELLEREMVVVEPWHTWQDFKSADTIKFFVCQWVAFSPYKACVGM